MNRPKALFYILALVVMIAASGSNSKAADDPRPKKFLINPDYDYKSKRFLVARIQEFFGLPFVDSTGAEILVNKDFPAEDNYTVMVDNTERPYRNLPEYLRQEIDEYPSEGLKYKDDVITWSSVFTYFWDWKFESSEIIKPPKNDSKLLITQDNTRNFINPYFSLFGGDRLGLPISITKGIGLSFGIGTPYSASLETNFFEANLHILGLYAGLFSDFGDITQFTKRNNYNTILAHPGFQVGWVPPIGTFLELGYQKIFIEMTDNDKQTYLKEAEIISKSGEVFRPKLLTGTYFNAEFRYPFRFFNSESGKAYMAWYQDEFHVGLKAYEMSVVKGNKIDLRIDFMTFSKERRDQLNLDILISGGGLFEEFANKNFAFGPSLSFSTTESNKPGLLKAYINLRLKVSDYFTMGN